MTRRSLLHNLGKYLAIAAYLYVCFGSLLIYKAMILRGYGIPYIFHGLAAVKALFLAKFVLLGDRLRLEAPFRRIRLIQVIIRKSLLFLLILAGLSVIEAAVVALIQRRPLSGALSLLDAGWWGEMLASYVLLLLILVPYIAYREIDSVLGGGKLRELLLRRV